MLTCSEHGWRQPCLTCQAENAVQMERMGNRILLGQVGGSLAPRVAHKMRRDGVKPLTKGEVACADLEARGLRRGDER
jgi:hypothetical protein